MKVIKYIAVLDSVCSVITAQSGFGGPGDQSNNFYGGDHTPRGDMSSARQQYDIRSQSGGASTYMGGDSRHSLGVGGYHLEILKRWDAVNSDNSFGTPSSESMGSSSNASVGNERRTNHVGSTGGMPFRKGYVCAYGGVNGMSWMGVAGAHMTDGGVSLGIGNGIGTGSREAYYARRTRLGLGRHSGPAFGGGRPSGRLGRGSMFGNRNMGTLPGGRRFGFSSSPMTGRAVLGPESSSMSGSDMSGYGRPRVFGSRMFHHGSLPGGRGSGVLRGGSMFDNRNMGYVDGERQFGTSSSPMAGRGMFGGPGSFGSVSNFGSGIFGPRSSSMSGREMSGYSSVPMSGSGKSNSGSVPMSRSGFGSVSMSGSRLFGSGNSPFSRRTMLPSGSSSMSGSGLLGSRMYGPGRFGTGMSSRGSQRYESGTFDSGM